MKCDKMVLGVAMLLLLCGLATAQGVNFSVKAGAQGMAGTGVAAQAASESPANDVFIGGGCTNYVRLLHTLLGLQTGDDMDALCYGPAYFVVNLAGPPEPGWFASTGDVVYWHFSVDGHAQGKAMSAVITQVAIGTMSCGEAIKPNEAHGDYFFTSLPFIGTNFLGADEALLGLSISGATVPHVDDDLNALDLNALLIDRLHPLPGQYLQPGDVYFSLAAGSPSLALVIGATEDDILTPNGSGGFQVYLAGASLGVIPGSDLDGLFFDASMTPFFSVKTAMTTLPPMVPNANPGDILVPDGRLFPPDGIADELIPARDLGLLDGDMKTRSGVPRIPDSWDDNLDALDAELFYVLEPTAPPSDAKDQALPENGVEGEGEPPIEGEGEPPVEGEGEPPIEGEGEPVEGEGEPEMQHGPNISVAIGAIGLPPLPLPREVNTEGTPWNDVYKAGGIPVTDSISFKRLTAELLGLTPADDIDAFSYGDPAVALPPLSNSAPPFWADGVPHGGWESSGSGLIFWHFSVDGHAVGKANTDVYQETTVGTLWNRVLQQPNEAHGDYFVTSTALPKPGGGRGSNLLAADEENLTLAIQAGTPNLHDDLNGLDLLAAPITRSPDVLQPRDIYFSLAAGSPSLAMRVDPVQGRPCHAADILTPDGSGGFRIARITDGLACDGNHERLGIPNTNDLDALYTDATFMPGRIPCFSVRDMIPSPILGHPDANPGDILVPDGMIYPVGAPAFDGVADELIPARSLGLRDLEDPLIGIAAYLMMNFTMLDVNGDTVLDWSEVSGTGMLTQDQFQELDVNGDDEIDMTELELWLFTEEDNLNALDAELAIVKATRPLDGVDDAGVANEGEGEPPVEGEGEPPVEGEGEPPVEGEGEPPVEGEGEPPVEGEGEPPVEGEGEPPVEGEGEPPVEGEGEPPVEGEGEPPVEGEGEGLAAVIDGPSLVSITVGASHTFSVSVTGNVGELSYQWYFDGADKSYAPIQDAEDAAYSIESAALGDSGFYYCEVSDASATVQSPPVQLSVIVGVPVAHLAGVALLAAACMLLGAAALTASAHRRTS